MTIANALPYHSRSEKLAPIALFVYNRPEHTRRTTKSLLGNTLARRSDLFVFSDAARDDHALPGVKAVREFIGTLDGFRTITVIERERNLGLAGSIISGVTQVCEEYGRAIVVEDDLLTAPDFLFFMNSALERYIGEPKVFSVSGFNYGVRVPKDYRHDAFFTYRSSSWGWGTWKDCWAKADWGVSDYAHFSSDKAMQRLFNRGGEDLSRMLNLQMAGEIDSWAIRWAYSHWKHEALTLLPTQSRIFNIGLDGSGVHCRRGLAQQSPIGSVKNCEFQFPFELKPDPLLAEQICRAHCFSLQRKCAQFIFRVIRKANRRIRSMY